jgi:hypothetical protein
MPVAPPVFRRLASVSGTSPATTLLLRGRKRLFNSLLGRKRLDFAQKFDRFRPGNRGCHDVRAVPGVPD